MSIEFYQYSSDYLREKVDPSDMWCFTFGQSKDGDYFMPIELFEDSKIKTMIAIIENRQAFEFMGKTYYSTKWLSERFNDARPYIKKLHQLAGSAVCVN